MSLLKFYTTSQIESQKRGYLNYFGFTTLQVDGDFIPAWFYELSDLDIKVSIQELNPNALHHGIIEVISSVQMGSYVTGFGNGYISADKQAYTLTGIYRLQLYTDSKYYYSDLFKNANTNLTGYPISYSQDNLILSQ